MRIIKNIQASINSASKRIFQAIRFGKDDVIEIEQAGEFGVDSCAPKNTPLLLVKTGRASYVVGSIVGFKESDYGETRLFSTDEEGKNISTFIHLLNDKEIHLGGNDYSAVRFEELEKAFNELKKDYNDLAQKWNTFTSSYAPGSPSSVGTPPTLAGQNATISQADLSNAESKEIKLK